MRGFIHGVLHRYESASRAHHSETTKRRRSCRNTLSVLLKCPTTTQPTNHSTKIFNRRNNDLISFGNFRAILKVSTSLSKNNQKKSQQRTEIHMGTMGVHVRSFRKRPRMMELSRRTEILFYDVHRQVFLMRVTM